MAGVIVLVATMALALASIGLHASDLARAQSAADAVALASVTAGSDDAVSRTANQVATRNDATLVRVRRLPDGDVEVVVRRGSAEATARARTEQSPTRHVP